MLKFTRLVAVAVVAVCGACSSSTEVDAGPCVDAACGICFGEPCPAHYTCLLDLEPHRCVPIGAGAPVDGGGPFACGPTYCSVAYGGPGCGCLNPTTGECGCQTGGAGCMALNGRCTTPSAMSGNCNEVGDEYRAPGLCDSPGEVCCVTPDSTGALVPALHDYGICFDLLCAAGHECIAGIDAEGCSTEPVSDPPDGGSDGGADAAVGQRCGLIHCSPGTTSCYCMDPATSHCSC